MTQQGASGSHMTAAEALDRISGLPGMSGEANDAVSACTQVRMSDAATTQASPRLLKLREAECPKVWVRLPRNRRPKHWDNIDDPMVPSERNLRGHPCGRDRMGKKTGRSLVARSWRDFHRQAQISLSVYVDDIKMGGRKAILAPVWLHN